ncbi:MAG TPA: 4-hydroxy-tetrahydrodipicolinate synthase [Thermoleophilaceae bacterium]
MTFGGILTAMVTPFDERGRVDEDAFVAMIHHLLENGSDGLVVAGTTGESATLSDDEKVHIWDLAVAEAGGAPVIAGTGTNDTAHSIHLTRKASETGVDGVLLVTPYYNKPNRRGLRAHFEAVAAATELPVVVYNIPGRCVIDLSNEFLRELAQSIPNVAAVKQARFEEIEPIDGMDLLAGNDDTLVEMLDKGGTGGICVSSHIVGAEMRRMIDEPEQRHEIHESLKDIFAVMFITASPTPVKAALNMLGIRAGTLRLPMVEASEEEEQEIRGVLERHGLLSAV